MPGSRIKIIKNTIHGNTGSGRTLCPMCAWWAKDAPMIQDPQSELWICSECGYKTSPNMGPIHESKIEAGNETKLEKPYIRSVSLTKKRDDKSEKIYSSASEAWNS